MRPTDNNRFTFNGYLVSAQDLVQSTKNGDKQMCKFLIEGEKMDAEDFPAPCVCEFSTFNRSQIARVLCCANGDSIQVTGYLEATQNADGRYFSNMRVSGIKVPDAAQQKATKQLEDERNKPRASDGLNFNGPAGETQATASAAKDDIPF